MNEITDPLFDWLNTPVPATLWHYTSLRGAQGIVSNREIFATDIRYLNDREEFIHVRKLAQGFVDSIPELCPNGWSQKRDLQGLLTHLIEESFLSPKKTQVFVACFSTAEDQLSQWRGYSGDSTGVSLGFDLKKLRPPSVLDTFVVFAPCVYEKNQKTKLVAHVLNRFIESGSAMWKEAGETAWAEDLMKRILERNPSATLPELKKEIFETAEEWRQQELQRMKVVLTRDLIFLAALLKDSSFKEEQEWRLVLPVFADSTPSIHPRQFRAGLASLIPYLKFPLTLERKEPVPLTELILGPGSEPQTASDAMRGFLTSQSIDVISKESHVPFQVR